VPCSATDGSFSTRVPVGTYTVLASQQDTSSSFPSDATFVVKTGFSVSAAAANLSSDERPVRQSGQIRVDGQAPIHSCMYDHVRLDFVGANGGAVSAYVPCSATDGSFSTRVPAGTYTVLASQQDTSSSFPSDATFVVKTGFSVSAAAGNL